MSLPAALGRLLPDLRVDAAVWRRVMRLGAVRGPEWFVRRSPALFGLAFAAALPETRRRVAADLARTGHPARPDLVARLFVEYAESLTEAFAVGGGRNERIQAEVRGDAAFREARALGRGIIVLTAHTSGWYAAGPVLGSAWDADVLVVMQRERDAGAQSIQDATRAEAGIRVVYAGEDPLSALPLVHHLQRGGVVALQVDRVGPGQRAVEAELFGAPFRMPEGPFALARVTGAPLVTVLARRKGFLRYELSVDGPILVPRGRAPEPLREAAGQVGRTLEAFARAHPTHWFQFGAGAAARNEVSPRPAMS